jgi:hypothetical protein
MTKNCRSCCLEVASLPPKNVPAAFSAHVAALLPWIFGDNVAYLLDSLGLFQQTV